MTTFRYFRNVTNLLILALFFYILILSSCKPNSQSTYQQRLVNTGQPAVHAVHDERLKEIMKELDTPAFSRMPQELEDQNHTDQYVQEVQQVAQSMAQAADSITRTAANLGLNEQQQKLFVTLATKLQKQATQLQNRAQQNDIDLINGEMATIASTCNACHSAFRIMPDKK